MHDLFLRFSTDKLRQLTERIDVCLGKLTPEQIWWRGSDTQNAIGNLVLHLCGNVRQWIITSVGGAPDVRNRDEEFAARGSEQDIEQLRRKLVDTTEEAITVINAVSADRLRDRINVQNYEVTVLEAIYHVVEHFAAHTGQILYATKLLTSEDLGFYKHLRRAAHNETTP